MSARFKDPLLWFRSLMASIIGGAAGSGASWLGMAAAKSAGIDVPALNLQALGVILVSSGLASMFMYLQKSPLPDVVTTDTTTTTREQVGNDDATITTTQKHSVKTNTPEL